MIRLKMPGLDAAESFLNALNGLHPNIHFTMELSNNDSIPFGGSNVDNKERQ